MMIVFAYAAEVMSLGLFYVEFCDAIKECDGLRLLRCWRYILPLFKVTGRRNYTLEVFYILYNYHFVLPPRQAQQLIMVMLCKHARHTRAQHSMRPSHGASEPPVQRRRMRSGSKQNP